MRTFTLQRDYDVSGVSGVGLVAEGVKFSDGKIALRWVTGDHHSTVVWDSIEAVEAVHGHGGTTRVIWDTYNASRPSAVDDPSAHVKPPNEKHTEFGEHDSFWVLTSCGHDNHPKYWSCSICGGLPGDEER